MHPTAAPTPPATASRLDQRDATRWDITSERGTSIELRFPTGPAFVLDGNDGQYVLPSDSTGRTLEGHGICWVLPESAESHESGWLIEADAQIAARFEGTSCIVSIDAETARLTGHRARPHADVRGRRFALEVVGGDVLADALAAFYWGTMLPCVVERTVAADYANSDGYVISTLADRYLGTYPDVDHEFQIKGRLAMGGAVDLEVVRRMIELQLRLMREDPQGLWRDPCAVQPDGDREYHVRRSSLDGSTNAVMFEVTGNIGVLEAIWLYIARTKDLDWLRANIEDIEGAASWVEDRMDRTGRLWSDVYYEDQVIKDGRETMSAALAVRSFQLLAELEDRIDRPDRARVYREDAAVLVDSMVQPLPVGFWDPQRNRFVDWVDRSGVSHDHIHLLANVLPALVGATSEQQTRDVADLVDREFAELQRFPTFLAARIEDYTEAEIGDGGPYDLCAAGRYWCWDAAYWGWRGRGDVLRDQLDRVAAQGAIDGYVMGERYDMEHVYYIDGSPWHGAAHYYEYPCVFAWVLLTEYLGLKASMTADLLVAPRLADTGAVRLEQEAYALRYAFDGEVFELENLADERRTFELDLALLFPTTERLSAGDRTLGIRDEVVLAPGQTVRLAAIGSGR